MKTNHVRVLFIILLVTIGLAATSNGQNTTRKSFLSILRVGESVNVKEGGGRYEISLMKDVQLSHKITEVGTDYVRVEDIAGVTEMTIPVYSIKCVVRLKIPGR